MGVWIDHRKATVVAITDHGEEIGLPETSAQLFKSVASTSIDVQLHWTFCIPW
jgi:hypothetical protein